MTRQTGKFARYQGSGFTLIEVLLSAAIIAVIMLGLQSAMVLAARAAPSRTTSNAAALRSGRALDQLASDLSYATSITTMTATTIEFTVPDRNGDGQPETIRYSWTGVSGDPLLRTVNNHTPAAIAPSVNEFQLIYDKRTQQRTQTYTESGEVLLNSYDGVGLLNLGGFVIDNNSYCAQYFKPSLPSGAASWRVTRVRFKAAKYSGNNGQTRIQLRTVNSGLPGTILEESTMYEVNLDSNWSWQEFPFTTVSGRTPGTGLFLTFQWAADAEACQIQYQSLLGADPNGFFTKTSTAGSSWTATPGQDLLYYVYGTYSTADPAAYNYWLTDVRCALRSGTDPLGRLRTTIRVVNEPQVSGP